MAISTMKMGLGRHVPIETDRLIWIETAVERYWPSRDTYEAAIKSGELHTERLPGTRRTFLIKSELEAWLTTGKPE